MRPCDCASLQDVRGMESSGISINEIGICIRPNYVELTVGPCMVKIYMRHFKALAEWYLRDQDGR